MRTSVSLAVCFMSLGAFSNGTAPRKAALCTLIIPSSSLLGHCHSDELAYFKTRERASAQNLCSRLHLDQNFLGVTSRNKSCTQRLSCPPVAQMLTAF